MSAHDLKVKVFADGADKSTMLALYKNPWVKGFTTNPTLMRKAGIRDYREFAMEIIAAIPDKPISFEVFSDEFEEMEQQALQIASWGSQVYVKIPITNTKGDFSGRLISNLSKQGVKLNVTAILTVRQVEQVLPCLDRNTPAYISVFAGRIADTGIDPMPVMAQVMNLLQPYPNTELIWASPREVLNVTHAEQLGCHIITVTQDILKKLELRGKDLAEYSIETVRMFYDDAVKAGYTLAAPVSISKSAP